MPSPNPLIVALDTPSPSEALKLVRRLKETGCAFKVGFELFTAAGPGIVKKIVDHDVRVFLDLKFHDIPHTVAKASEVATHLGVWMFNVHASGGLEMMKAARAQSLARAQQMRVGPPLLIAVTVLTSTISLNEINVPLSVPDQVASLARLAHLAGLSGVVASAQEVAMLRRACPPDFCLVTPGIRMPSNSADDQKRTMTPKGAMENGSDFLVVGRPITQAKSPLKAVDQILESIR